MPRAPATTRRWRSSSAPTSSTTAMPSSPSCCRSSAPTGGLPGLKGAKIQLVVADNQGTPAAGAEPDAAPDHRRRRSRRVIGAYQSGITETASAIAEKYGIPFVNPELVAANLTERGFKWFFRVDAGRRRLRQAYSDFLKEQKAAGKKVDSIAIIHENTEYGNSVVEGDRRRLQDRRPQRHPEHRLLGQLDRRAAAGAAAQGEEPRRGDLHLLHVGRDPLHQDDEGAELEAGDPDRRRCGLQRSHVRQEHGLAGRGPDQPHVLRAGKPGSVAAIFDALYKKKTNGDGLDDVSGRGLQGLLVLADAINRAGSTEPAKIQAALKATDLKQEQMAAGYRRREVRRQGPERPGLQHRHADARRPVRARCGPRPTPPPTSSCRTRAGKSPQRPEQVR